MKWLIVIKLIMVIISWCISQIIMLYHLAYTVLHINYISLKLDKKTISIIPKKKKNKTLLAICWTCLGPFHYEYVWNYLKTWFYKNSSECLIRAYFLVSSSWYSTIYNSYWAVWREQITIPVKIRYATGLFILGL